MAFRALEAMWGGLGNQKLDEWFLLFKKGMTFFTGFRLSGITSKSYMILTSSCPSLKRT